MAQQFAEPNPLPNPAITSVGENVLPPTAATTCFSAKGDANIAGCIAGVSGVTCYRNNTASIVLPATVGVGSIGYVEAANTRYLINLSKGISIALVNYKSSVRNLPEAANGLGFGSNILSNTSIETQVHVSGTGEPIAGAGGLSETAAIPPSVTGTRCVVVVNPNAYNAGSRGYPILAVSNLLFSYRGNSSNSTVNNTNVTAKLQNLAVTLNGNNATTANYLFNNGYQIGAGPKTSGTPIINTVDASTPVTGTGTTGFSTLPKSFQRRPRQAASKTNGFAV